MDKKIGGIDNRLEKIEAGVTFIKRDVRDIKVDISDVLTGKEHEELKAKVEKYHSLF